MAFIINSSPEGPHLHWIDVSRCQKPSLRTISPRIFPSQACTCCQRALSHAFQPLSARPPGTVVTDPSTTAAPRSHARPDDMCFRIVLLDQGYPFRELANIDGRRNIVAATGILLAQITRVINGLAAAGPSLNLQCIFLFTLGDSYDIDIGLEPLYNPTSTASPTLYANPHVNIAACRRRFHCSSKGCF